MPLYWPKSSRNLTSQFVFISEPRNLPLALPWLFRYCPPAVAKVYSVSFRTHDNRRPSKFISYTNAIPCHKIAHVVRGEHRKHDDANAEERADDRAEKWGFSGVIRSRKCL
jgi:hypothetical protein